MDDALKAGLNLWFANKIDKDTGKLKDSYGQAAGNEMDALNRIISAAANAGGLQQKAQQQMSTSMDGLNKAIGQLGNIFNLAGQERQSALQRAGYFDQNRANELENLDLVGKIYAQEDLIDKTRLNNKGDLMSAALGQLRRQMGANEIVDGASINRDAAQILEGYQADIDRAMTLANSEGVAANINRGLDMSTQEADRRDEIVRKFAPLFMNARNQAVDAAIARASGITRAAADSRNQAIAEVNAEFSPAVALAQSLYRPRDAEIKTKGALATAFDKMFTDERNYANDQMKFMSAASEAQGRLSASGADIGRLYQDDINKRDLGLIELLSKNRTELAKMIASGEESKALHGISGMQQLAPFLSPIAPIIAEGISKGASELGTAAWNWLTDGFDMTFG